MLGIEERTAPQGKFRMIGVDTFDNSDWVEKDFSDRKEAIEIASIRGGVMLKMYVYDDQGKCIFQSGTY